MNWQEACIKSSYKTAYRMDFKGKKYFRDIEGNALMKIHKDLVIVDRSKVEGYCDWMPYEFYMKKREDINGNQGPIQS